MMRKPFGRKPNPKVGLFAGQAADGGEKPSICLFEGIKVIFAPERMGPFTRPKKFGKKVAKKLLSFEKKNRLILSQRI